MSIHSKNTPLSSRSNAAALSAQQHLQESTAVPPFRDMRPEHETMQKLSVIAANSPQITQLARMQSVMRQRSMEPEMNGNHTAPVQRQVIESPGYKLQNKDPEDGWEPSLIKKIVNGWANLDAATGVVQKEVDKKIHTGRIPKTNHWASYVKNPTAASYGYLIEEGLNDHAASMGWALQVKLEGARPDFGRKLGGKWIMADLTTTAQSQGAGMHIQEKLEKSNLQGSDFVAAADITYDRPGVKSIPIIPARQQAIAIHDNIYKDRDDDDYDPMQSYLQKHLSLLPHPTDPDPDTWQAWIDHYEEVKNSFQGAEDDYSESELSDDY